ncbi:MAG: Glyoxalase/Bleomycin resistance protein/Dioxygenase superfamily [Paenibacillaceae bacterium]|nr:Glyoxalase/Bleomycin resistance protein/Dioxygenase superfamily [Paenibacillaceae bacterium]
MKQHYKGLSFLELPVSNFSGARRFYEHTLEFTLAHLDESNQWCLYTVPGSQTGVALYHFPASNGVQQQRCAARIVLRVDNLDEVLDKLAERGVSTEPVRIHSEEAFRISGFSDMDGNIWRIWSPLTPQTATEI